ncbi:M24 family metallopeptidase [Zavarzinella formosa]|uniref:M24 family metallopeptidase n=1 Tax=Zavarzinella formosa TaxID=360055 RepID=UPI0002F75730|nr:Xaa-Pro peptidase family protein [Zavarzinella formosa]
MDQFQRRRKELMQAVKAAKVDALLVSKAVNVSYLTGFTGDASFLLVTPKRCIILSDERFRIQLKDECPTVEAEIRGADRNTFQLTGAIVGKLGLRDMFVEATGLTLNEFETLKDLCKSANLAPKNGMVEELRAIKDTDEVDRIRHAIRIAEQSFLAAKALLRPADTEKGIADLIDQFIKRLGGTGHAFSPIVGVGERSALPHCPVTDKPLSDSWFMLVDWGAEIRQYHSDLTRVIPTPDARRRKAVESKLQKTYTIVAEAQARAVEKLRPGIHVREADNAARGHIRDSGFGDYFNHGLGHGLGLEVHEAPSIRWNSEDVLKAGMVVTVEPGIYLPDIGGVRVEDDFLITEDGPVRLTTLPREWDAYFN